MNWPEFRAWFTLISGAIAFLAGLYQYRRAQKWKQLEWIATEVKAFLKDPHIAIGLQILDWNTRRLPMLLDAPEEIREKSFDYSVKMLEHALTSGSRPQQNPYSDQEIVIRDCMDRLLDGLERFEVFIQAKLISQEELYPFIGYWLEILGDPNNPRKSKEARGWIQTYASDFGFDNVSHLLNRYRSQWNP